MILWHVDDVKSSHIDPKVNDSFIKWLKKECGQLGKVKSSRAKKHDYLGMTLDCSVKGKVTIDMCDCAKKMVAEFPQEALQGPKAQTPASTNLFSVGKRSLKLSQEEVEMFHSFVLKSPFLRKRGRPDVLQLTAHLHTCTTEPTRFNWDKLV
jgi:hypothetical protein